METSRCIICGSNSSSLFLEVYERFNLSDDAFRLEKCECGFIFLNPRPTIDEIKKYYNVSNYDPHNINNKTIWKKLYYKIQILTLKWKKNIIEKYFERGRLLDVGGGDGNFSNAMYMDGWKVTLQDKFINSNHNPKIKFITDLSEINENNIFDVITFWHSLEHIHEIDKVLIKTEKLLVKKGVLLIAIPNFNSYERKKYGIKWAPYDAPRHLYHFSPENFKQLIHKYGFRIIDKKIMIQDIFYNVIVSTDLNIKSIVLSFSILIRALLVIIFSGYKKSSSILYICKKK